MPEQRDPYDVLGVSRAASDDDIRRTYLKLAHKYHPDKTGGDKAAETKLKEVNAAYDVLKNPDKRAQYDQFGHMGDAFAGAGAGPFGRRAGAGGAGDFEAPFEDLFDMLFGRGRGRRSSAAPGRDLETRVQVSLRETAVGCNKKVRFDRMDACAECRGSGAASGSKPETCAQCRGAGQVRMSQGFFTVTRPCPRCRGTGSIIADPCRRCTGHGYVRTRREVAVDIPAGVDTGSRLRVSGEGEPGTGGGPRGDLYIFIEVPADDLFERDGSTMIREVPVRFTEAALGATIRVPTLTGEAELKIPAGTQSGALLRLRGLGLPDVHGYRQGDQIVRVQVETPAKLTRRQKELLGEFEEQGSAKTYPRHRRFLDMVKRFQRE